MDNFYNYSVLPNDFELIEQADKVIIKKTIRKKSLKISLSGFKKIIDKYIKKLICAGLPIPSVLNSLIEDESIIYWCEYLGDNFIEKFADYVVEEDFRFILNKITDILTIARSNNLWLDPHPKNFVVDKKSVHFVDFCPPYGVEYNELCLNSAKKSDRGIVKLNLSYFSPDFLGYHFLADFFDPRVGKKFHGFIPYIYNKLIEKKLVDLNYKQSLRQAEKIRKLENERLRKNIFLI